ncbi:MAG: hypothetical protein AAF351_06690 [Pseudomonadota bacterium]
MSISMMDLWLPIVVGAVLAWVTSALIHMVVKYHNSDYQPLANEDEVMDAVRNGSPSPGMHTFPYCADFKDMANEDVQAKFNKGPVGMLTIIPNGMPPMGKLLAQQIAFFLLGSILIAYCAQLALDPNVAYMTVFQFVAAVGFLAYGWATIPFAIWFGQKWSTTAKYLLDALIYGFVTAGAFAWLWPSAG